MKPVFDIKFTIFCILIINYIYPTYATQRDTVKHELICQSVIPVTLISTSCIITGSNFEKNFQDKFRGNLPDNFRTHIDNYLPYVPVGEIYLADLLSIPSKNNVFNQTKYLAISNLITAAITHGLKYSVDKTRPDGSHYSYPSGHTSFSFTNATVLYHEFNNSNKLLAYSGFLIATGTGTLRIANNRHWLSDVLAGAGIGMLVTHLVYYYEPLKNFNPFGKNIKLACIPVWDNNYKGFLIHYTF